MNLKAHQSKKIIFAALFLIMTATFSFNANAQKVSDFIFEKYSIQNGLSQSQANCIYQDKLGYIWVGTQGGMNQYDGHGVKKIEPIASDGLPEAPKVNGGLFGHSRVQEIIEKNALKDAAGIKNELVAAVDLWLSGENNPDDSTIIVTKKKINQ